MSKKKGNKPISIMFLVILVASALFASLFSFYLSSEKAYSKLNGFIIQDVLYSQKYEVEDYLYDLLYFSVLEEYQYNLEKGSFIKNKKSLEPLFYVGETKDLFNQTFADFLATRIINKNNDIAPSSLDPYYLFEIHKEIKEGNFKLFVDSKKVSLIVRNFNFSICKNSFERLFKTDIKEINYSSDIVVSVSWDDLNLIYPKNLSEIINSCYVAENHDLFVSCLKNKQSFFDVRYKRFVEYEDKVVYHITLVSKRAYLFGNYDTNGNFRNYAPSKIVFNFLFDEKKN